MAVRLKYDKYYPLNTVPYSIEPANSVESLCRTFKTASNFRLIGRIDVAPESVMHKLHYPMQNACE
ncbi:hypothetical protein CES86_1002 [Brucella lupini]|uniref:Uncharacterized protein n=1 Tax=Brucella lupini TaxID=255457 RepID=A0A256GWJ6_9HYPH|nr:hypothetical protein CES86_1002 [Brucella lupini]